MMWLAIAASKIVRFEYHHWPKVSLIWVIWGQSYGFNSFTEYSVAFEG
jgi:hypothetical protein